MYSKFMASCSQYSHQVIFTTLFCTKVLTSESIFELVVNAMLYCLSMLSTFDSVLKSYGIKRNSVKVLCLIVS